MGYWIGSGSRRVGVVELLLEESEKVIVLDLGETRGGGTGEVPKRWCGVIHGLVRAGRKERCVGVDGRDIKRKEGRVAVKTERVWEDKGGNDRTGSMIDSSHSLLGPSPSPTSSRQTARPLSS